MAGRPGRDEAAGRLKRRLTHVSAVILSAVLVAGCTSQTLPSSTATASPAAVVSDAPSLTESIAIPSASSTDSASPSADQTEIPTPVVTPAPTMSAEPTTAPTPLVTPTPSVSPTPRPTPVPGPTLAQLIGQKLVVAMEGTTASPDLLGRIRRGEVGGVILFGSNIVDASQVSALTKSLRAAASAGGQPAFLIATDQEGGQVKRIAWAPPTLSPPQMGADGRTSVALGQGSDTATALHGLGINVDLAPVADVPASSASFMYQQGRTWSFDAGVTTRLSDAFASGLDGHGVIASMKHFPGIGYATHNTDTTPVTINATKGMLATGLAPYQDAISHGLPLIMLSNATYSAYDPNNAAGWSYSIGLTLLRGDLGFRGVTITDALDGTAASRGVTTRSLATRATAAGTDMLLLTGSEISSRGVYADLLAKATAGFLSTDTLRASYARVLKLKAGL